MDDVVLPDPFDPVVALLAMHGFAVPTIWLAEIARNFGVAAEMASILPDEPWDTADG